jgi:hypothetical protein
MSIVVSILYCHCGEEVQRDREECKTVTKNGHHMSRLRI